MLVETLRMNSFVDPVPINVNRIAFFPLMHLYLID